MASNRVGTILPVVPSIDGHFVAGFSNNRVTIRASTGTGKENIVRTIDIKNRFTTSPRFIRWSRQRGCLDDSAQTESQRFLCSGGRSICIWDLEDDKWTANIQELDSDIINVEFGATHDEVVAFHSFNTKMTIFSLKTGQGQAIKSPKFSYSNGFAYRPKTGHLAILLKMESVDTLTIHETETYDVINTVAVPTVDAQGVKWSPDGSLLLVWDTASMGTKVVIYTADGQLFKTFTGRGEGLDLGVRTSTWSPTSQVLGIGNHDGSVDFLGGDTLTLTTTIFHSIEENQADSPDVWRERYTEADGLYHYFPTADLLSLPLASTNLSRAVVSVEFNCTGTMISTLSHSFPNVVWIWSVVGVRPNLTAVLILESNVRQILWNPLNPDLLLVTNECHTPTIHEWVPHRSPRVCRVPIKPDNGKHEAKWLGDVASRSIFLFGSAREYVVGRIYENSEEFETVQSWEEGSSHISSASRSLDLSGG